MAIIDQHAAHERVLFERLQDQVRSGTLNLQNLLIPVQLELGPAQSSLLADRLEEMAGLGFIVEDFGNGAFFIKAVPSLLVGADYRQLLLGILDELAVHGQSRSLDKENIEILSVMACHPAIKINRKLDIREMEALLHDLSLCRMPHTCPHGRPTVLNLSVQDLKKMFKRT
jgi:DNA mismatch repair protein MutL